MLPSADSIQSSIGLLIGAFVLTSILTLGFAIISSSILRSRKSDAASRPEYQPPTYADSSDRVFAEQVSPLGISAYQVPWETLTAREKQIARLIAAGKSDEEIAQELYISRRTAQNHAYSIFRKMGISQRGELKHIIPALLN